MAMPYVAWSSTRFCVTVFSTPPAIRIPTPYVGYSRSFVSAVVELLSWT